MTQNHSLHLVNKSPTKCDALSSCLRHAMPHSTILLYEEGVYAAIAETSYAEELTKALTQHSIYALAPDLQARGIATLLIEGIKLIAYDEFVDLVAKHHPVISWN